MFILDLHLLWIFHQPRRAEHTCFGEQGDERSASFGEQSLGVAYPNGLVVRVGAIPPRRW